jgi:hypothetical protein
MQVGFRQVMADFSLTAERVAPLVGKPVSSLEVPIVVIASSIGRGSALTAGRDHPPPATGAETDR